MLTAGFSHTPPRIPFSLNKDDRGKAVRKRSGVYVDQRIGNAKGHPDLPLAEVFSEYPVARHFVCPKRSIWGAISKTLLAWTLVTPGRVGFARGRKLLPFLFYRLNREPSEFPQPTGPSDWSFDAKRSRSILWSAERRCTRAKPAMGWGLRMVRPERFELPTFWFVARRSIQLS